MTKKEKVAVIGTGGTISAIGVSPYDFIDYDSNGEMLHADELIERIPGIKDRYNLLPVRCKTLPSTSIYFPEWKELIAVCNKLVLDHPDLSGIVILHGTASLEETAYFLNLTLKVGVSVVVVGSQRPFNVLSSDASLNFVNAVRVAADMRARGRGVLVVLNDEIHAAREVTKTSTYRLHTFRSPDVGVLGFCDGDTVEFYRWPARSAAPQTEFDVYNLSELPQVDIAYSYTGADGTVIDALRGAGARGIVSAGFAPGCCTPSELIALTDAVQSGVVVVQSSRAGSGRVGKNMELTNRGILSADNLNPQKARLLLALALTKTSDINEVERIFRTY